MIFAKLAGLILSGMVFSAGALAGSVSDTELKTALIGSWVTPPDGNADKVPVPSRQIFQDDGTTQLFIYATAECRIPAAAIEGRWTIKDGVLSTQVTGTTDPRLIAIGQIQKVVIVSVEQDRVVFDADNELFVREKSETCYPAGARRI